jgi:hypothetical protein
MLNFIENNMEMYKEQTNTHSSLYIQKILLTYIVGKVPKWGSRDILGSLSQLYIDTEVTNPLTNINITS